MKNVVREVQDIVIGREEVIEGVAIALIAGEHVMIFGPPGCAKSLLVRELCARVQGAQYFEWLMTKFTTPEEVFGPMKVSGLLEDRYERNTRSKLPEAHIGFLDEIWKSSSAILNTLLTLANERVFHNGDRVMQTPLLSLIGASNEPPQEEGLGVLYDRFLMRFWTKYLPPFYLENLLQVDGSSATPQNTLPFSEIENMRYLLSVVRPSKDITERLIAVINDLRSDGFVLSDRRITKLPKMLSASAILAQRTEVTEEDSAVLPYVLASAEPEQRVIRESVAKFFTSKKMVARSKFDAALEEFHAAPIKPSGLEERKALAQAAVALSKISQELRLLDDAAGSYPDQVAQLTKRLEERAAESLK